MVPSAISHRCESPRQQISTSRRTQISPTTTSHNLQSEKRNTARNPGPKDQIDKSYFNFPRIRMFGIGLRDIFHRKGTSCRGRNLIKPLKPKTSKPAVWGKFLVGNSGLFIFAALRISVSKSKT